MNQSLFINLNNKINLNYQNNNDWNEIQYQSNLHNKNHYFSNTNTKRKRKIKPPKQKKLKRRRLSDANDLLPPREYIGVNEVLDGGQAEQRCQQLFGTTLATISS